jgi:hypothetical protein
MALPCKLIATVEFPIGFSPGGRFILMQGFDGNAAKAGVGNWQ